MLDHIGLRVADYARALAFYRSALAPIGYQVLMEFPGAAGLGLPGKPDFWIMHSEHPTGAAHVAFTSDRSCVDAFYAAALAAGGTDNGPPGLRLDYHPNYYGAFVRDPEGNNIEVVCHDPPGGAARKSAAARPRRAKPGKAKPGKTSRARAQKAKARVKPKAKPKRKR